jgi:hypothetical protein
LNDGLLYISAGLVLLPTYEELNNKPIYYKVRSEVLGPVTTENKTVLFLGDTMQIDIQAKTFLQITGTDHQYYSVTEKSTAIFRTFFSRVSVLILLHILYKCWPTYVQALVLIYKIINIFMPIKTLHITKSVKHQAILQHVPQAETLFAS